MRSWNVEPNKTLTLKLNKIKNYYNSTIDQRILFIKFLHDIKHIILINNLGYLILVSVEEFAIVKVAHISKIDTITSMCYLADNKNIIFSTINESSDNGSDDHINHSMYIFNFKQNQLKKLKLTDKNLSQMFMKVKEHENNKKRKQASIKTTIQNITYAYDGERVIFNYGNYLVNYNFKTFQDSNCVYLNSSNYNKIEEVNNIANMSYVKDNLDKDFITNLDYDHYLTMAAVGFNSGLIILYQTELDKPNITISDVNSPILGLKFKDIKAVETLIFYYEANEGQSIFTFFNILESVVLKSVHVNNVPTCFDYCNDNKTLFLGYSQGTCVLKNFENKIQKDMIFKGEKYEYCFYLNDCINFICVNSNMELELWSCIN